MVEEDIDMDDFIKMEIDIDDEDLVEWALEETICEDDDPLLMLKPIIYTTRLDEMNVLKQDWQELDAKHIIDRLQSENKPIFTLESSQRSSSSGNIQSFMKLSQLVNDMNFKTRLEALNANTRNINLLKQCIPLKIVLNDINKQIPATVTSRQNELQCESALIVSSNIIAEVQVKVEAIDSIANEIKEPETRKKVIASSSNKINEGVKIRSSSTEITISESNKAVPITEENVSFAKSSKIATKNSSECINSAKFSKMIEPQRKKQPGTINLESPDEGETASVNVKRQSTASLKFHQFSITKYALIVLLREKGEASVYRVSSSKLVTDYYVTNEYDEYKLAAMYPKEEKIIESYCCWFKREEVITKICLKKNYPFSIQKFLRQPHTCLPGPCGCCCYNNNTNQYKEIKTKRRDLVKKSVAVADTWIRGLLNRNSPATVGLVAKALSYIPKLEAKEKPVEIELEKYVKSVLLCFKYSGKNNNKKNFTELYEIGKNGNVVRSFLLDNYEKERYIRRLYYIMMGDVKATEISYCCWYKREKIMHDLRIAKISPFALKLIQKPHICAKKKCKCCCKPGKVPLKPIQTLPTTLKHTTAYEKNVSSLTVQFNGKSKCPINSINEFYPTFTKIQNVTDAGVLKVASCTECNSGLSINILSKFRNLKLGVNNDGQLETILNAPARNLSIPELKVLSDILAHSTKQMTLLGISPEEFCNRVNSKSGQLNCADPEISLINTPSSPQNQISHSQERVRLTTSPVNQNNSINNSPIPISPTNSTQEIKEESMGKLILPPQIHNNPAIETVNRSTKPIRLSVHSVKSVVVTFSSISNLMETKNKNYVDSFKSFFENNVPYDVVVPEMSKFPHVSGLDTVTNMKQEQASLPGLPKISEIFSLATSLNEKSDIGMQVSQDPSGIIRLPQKESSKIIEENTTKTAILESSITTNPALSVAFNDNENTGPRTVVTETYGKSTKRKGPRIDYTQLDKKIRVKSENEFIARKTRVPKATASSNLQTQPIAIWPAPIVIKRDPMTNIVSLVKSSKSTAKQINPQHSQSRVANNVVTSGSMFAMTTTSTSAGSNLYQINENGAIKFIPAPTSNNNSAGFRYLTLTPLIPSKTNNLETTMLEQILRTPEVRPTPGIPPLVPFKTVIPETAKKKSSDQTHLENSVHYNLIIDNTEKKELTHLN